MLGIFISFPLQVIYLQDAESLFQSLTSLNIAVAFLCLFTAISAYNVHKTFHFLIPVTFAAVIFNNWWVGYVGLNYSLTETSVASLIFVIFCALLLEKNAFKVLRNPQLKWWNIAVRRQTEIPVSLFFSRGETLIKKSFDISESGLFLHGLETNELERLIVGEKLNLCMHFGKILKIRCDAKIVRKNEARGIYPGGVGLRFEEMDAQIKSAIKKLSEPSHEVFQ